MSRPCIFMVLDLYDLYTSKEYLPLAKIELVSSAHISKRHLITCRCNS